MTNARKKLTSLFLTAGMLTGINGYPNDNAVTSNGASKTALPNVLFIVADDLGWGDVGYNGSPFSTPNIDRLASLGIRLDQHYVCPVCTPTRVGLLTGLYPSRFGKIATFPTNSPVIPDGYRTMATMFRNAGYSTGLFGKWHLGSAPEFYPGRFGFEYSYGSLSGGVDPYTHLYKKGPFSRSWHRNGKYVDESGHASDLITEEATRWISQQNKPWFCYVPFTAVHVPVNAPEKWVDRYEPMFKDLDPVRARSMKLYGAYLSHMDECIGQLVESIKRKGCMENTIIVFVSDNGAPAAEHAAESALFPGFHEQIESVGSNAPLRGWKVTLYEGGIRTPCAVLWQGHTSPRTMSDVASVCDWMPTFAEMLGAKPDPRWDGKSLWPVLTGAKPSISSSRALYWDLGHRQFAARKGEWKLIYRPADTPKTELFHIASDPLERHEVSEKHPDVVADLVRQIEETHRNDDSNVRPQQNEAPAMIPFADP